MGCIVTQDPRAWNLRLGWVLRKDHGEDQRGDKWCSVLTRQGGFSSGRSELRRKAADPSQQSWDGQGPGEGLPRGAAAASTAGRERHVLLGRRSR